MIRRAKISEIPEIMVMCKACAAHMISNGIFQWNDHYPNAKAFENDLEREELYVLLVDNKLSGTIVLSSRIDSEYKTVDWASPTSKNMYIHRLGIHPSIQGQGYAQKLMNFAENYARENNFVSIRLDTFSQNKRNQKFYEKRGYQRLGDIYYPKQSEHAFHCYELLL